MSKSSEVGARPDALLDRLGDAGGSMANLVKSELTLLLLGLQLKRVVVKNLLGHPEVNISPKISISAQPLKMALHRNPAMHGSRMVIFLHDSKKAFF